MGTDTYKNPSEVAGPKTMLAQSLEDNCLQAILAKSATQPREIGFVLKLLISIDFSFWGQHCFNTIVLKRSQDVRF